MAFKLELDGKIHTLAILARRPHLVVSVDGRRHVIEDAGEAGGGERAFRLDGEMIRTTRVETSDGAIARLAGRSHAVRRIEAAASASSGGGANVVRAPMPGVVITIHKAPGDRVTRGETVITIESMKLQMKLDAPRDGWISEIGVRQGEGFDKDSVLARLLVPAEEG